VRPLGDWFVRLWTKSRVALRFVIPVLSLFVLSFVASVVFIVEYRTVPSTFSFVKSNASAS
jgi:hypothetical protein